MPVSVIITTEQGGEGGGGGEEEEEGIFLGFVTREDRRVCSLCDGAHHGSRHAARGGSSSSS